ncbi:MAG: hypothetical protein BGO29_07455 [Bacteroidales bacterium 36-12]|nr:MAG: hypothetical protein BGO29_07455 [Bacteroidales bacterium 36-12]
MMKLFKPILKAIKRLRYKISYRKMMRLQSFKHFRRECRRAERYAAESNKRYRVYLFDRYRALSREDITRMKNYGIISKKQETGMYSRLVLYDTLTHANTHPDFSNRKII